MIFCTKVIIFHSTLLLFLFGSFFGHSGAAQLLPTDPEVNEGPCRTFTPVNESSYNTIYTSLMSTFGSVSHFRLIAEAFLGRPARTNEEIVKICHIMLLTDFTSVTHIVYGDRIYVANGVINPPFVYQWPRIPLAKSPGVLNLPYHSTIIWTHPDHLLFADCFDGRINKWKLVSQALPTAEVKAEVLNQIERVGFNRNLAWDLTDESQSGIPYPCFKSPPSFAEAAAAALLGLDMFNDQSQIYPQLPQQVTFQGQGFSTLAEYYKVLLAPIRHFVQEAIDHCAREEGPKGHAYDNDKKAYEVKGDYYPPKNTSQPLGCQLFKS